MGREVRRVPPEWQHPKKPDGSYKPLYDESYREAVAEWKEGYAQWERGFRKSFMPDDPTWIPRDDCHSTEFWEYNGHPPEADDYRPDWPEETRTHLQMYETTSEGTPISPVMPDAESLARWLAGNKASAFAGMTATYDEWLATIRRGSAFSAMMGPGGFVSGVAAQKALEDRQKGSSDADK